MTPRNMRNDESAETGIGTMIVFIAAVLVAAIAAGVLISTSGKLQEKSSRTGEEATEQVSSNMQVESIVGKRDNTGQAGLQDLELYLALSPGATELDLSQLKLQLQDDASVVTLGYVAPIAPATEGVPTATKFAAVAVRDSDSSFTGDNPVMTAGDLVTIKVDLNAASMAWAPREEVRLVLLPEVGNSVVAGFDTPNSYGTKLVIELA